MAAAALVLACSGLVVGMIIIHLRDKQGRETRIEVPERGGKPTAPAGASAPGVDAEWIRSVALLTPQEQVEAVTDKLQELNPGFDGNVKSVLTKEGVTRLELETHRVTDLSPLQALRGLKALKCRGTDERPGRLVELAPLRGLPLQELDCSRNVVANLGALKGLPLKVLECHFNWRIRDLEPLRGMELVYLDCGATAVSSLAPLQDMPLSSLSCGSTKITDLRALKGMRLKSLMFPTTRVSSLAPLRGMPLEVLSFRETDVTDLSLLQRMPLRRIYVDVKSARDVELLRSIKSLKEINDRPAAEFWKEMKAARKRGTK